MLDKILGIISRVSIQLREPRVWIGLTALASLAGWQLDDATMQKIMAGLGALTLLVSMFAAEIKRSETKALQGVVGVRRDGFIGPATMTAVVEAANRDPS